MLIVVVLFYYIKLKNLGLNIYKTLGKVITFSLKKKFK